MFASLSDRFWSRVDKNGPIHPVLKTRCWLWTGSTFKSTGYGQIWHKRRNVQAHRVSFFLKHGRWPDPNCLHKCDIRACVNDDHLFEGTQADNIHDMWAKGRGASGDRHGSRTHPERLPRGEEHSRRTKEGLRLKRLSMTKHQDGTRVSIIVDAASMWMDAKKYGEAHNVHGAMLDYNRLKRKLVGRNGIFTEAWVYLSSPDFEKEHNRRETVLAHPTGKLDGFSRALAHMGYSTTVIPGGPKAVNDAIVGGMFLLGMQCDVVCLVASEGDYTGSLHELSARGKRVVVCNFNQAESSISVPIEPNIQTEQLNEEVLLVKKRHR